MKTKLIIKRVEEKLTASGQPMLRIFTGNGWMSCFDESIFDEIKAAKGEDFGREFNVEINGKYKHIVADDKNEGDPEDKHAFTKKEQKSPLNKDDRVQTLIVRQCCLKAAVELFNGFQGTKNKDELMTIAEEMENWVFR